MYESYWHLDRKPFDCVADASSYYPCETHQGAMLKLRYAIETRAPAAVLVGEAGLGKTLVAELLQQRIAAAYAPWIWIRYPQMSAAELLGTIANAFDPARDAGSEPGLDESLRRILTALAHNSARGQHAVLVVDEAQSIPAGDALEALRLLTNQTVEGRPALTLLLIGQGTLLPRLDRSPAFEQRLSVKCMLRPLALEETISYVTHRLAAAGASREIFDSDALETLHGLCCGNPRRINRLADLALLVGYAEEAPSLGAEQVRSVSEDLVALSIE